MRIFDEIKTNYEINLDWEKRHPSKTTRDDLLRQVCFLEAVIATVLEDVQAVVENIKFEDVDAEVKNESGRKDQTCGADTE